MSEATPAYSTTLIRGLSVLKCFTQSSQALGASEIAKMTGIPQPTVWRFCQALQTEGYLVSDATGTRFMPGLAVLNLGFSAIGRYELADLARPYVMGIAEEFHAVAGIAIPDGLNARYIQRYQAPEAMLTYNIRVGWALPFTKASSGWSFLAIMGDEERERTMKELAKSDPKVWAQVEKPMRTAIAEFAQRKATITIDVLYPGLSSAAVPIISSKTSARYAIYCTGMTSMLTKKVLEEKVIPRLHLAAEALSVALASENQN